MSGGLEFNAETRRRGDYAEKNTKEQKSKPEFAEAAESASTTDLGLLCARTSSSTESVRFPQTLISLVLSAFPLRLCVSAVSATGGPRA